MTVAWVGSEPWLASWPWAQQHPTSDRNTYLDSDLTSDGVTRSVITGGPQILVALTGLGPSLAPQLTAVLTIE